uniref:Uncharacterized protein n=1 Tax=Plectus sambesii TaxID=2011161 RepID=A0A914V683_9BILA
MCCLTVLRQLKSLTEPCRSTATALHCVSLRFPASYEVGRLQRFYFSSLPSSKRKRELKNEEKAPDNKKLFEKAKTKAEVGGNRSSRPIPKDLKLLKATVSNVRKKSNNSARGEIKKSDEAIVSLPPDFEDKLRSWPNLLKCEIQQEVDRIDALMKSGPLEELVASGAVIGHLTFYSDEWYVGLKRLLRFRLPKNRSFPQTSLTPGSPLCISDAENHLVPLCEAILVSVKQKTVTVFITADKFSNIEQALSDRRRTWVVSPSKANPSLERLLDWSYLAAKSENKKGLGVGVDLLLYAYRAKMMHFVAADDMPRKFFYNLNDPQKKAVAAALNPKRPLVAIQGPPGTGKTLVVAEIIRQCVRERKRVLVCAASNVAVDNILMRVKDDVPLVRLGIASNETAQQFSIDDELNCGKYAGDLQLKYKQLMQLRFAVADIDEREKDEKIKRCLQEIRKIEQQAKKDIVEEKLVFFSTLTSSMMNILSVHRLSPDLVIIDEAAQAMEVSSWIPILTGARCVLTGDHCQLPPVVLSQQAQEGGLGVSLMQRLSTEFKPISQMLTVQHRMHEKIMKWSSEYFYDGKLEAAESVKNVTLSQISQVPPGSVQDQPLLLIDTAGRDDMREQRSSFAESIGNPGEARLAAIYLQKLIDFGVKQTDIGIITPYALQAALIKELVSDRFPQVMVNTVDSFQGQEKEAIILSMVRSNERPNNQSKVGFLADDRRINVSVTRAKKHLVVIADSATVTVAKPIASLLGVIRRDGTVQDASDYDEDVRRFNLSAASIERVWTKAVNTTKRMDAGDEHRVESLVKDGPPVAEPKRFR